MSTFTIFVVLITIVCFLLIIVIMVQNPKGGGLSSSITGTQMLGGVQKTTDFLDKSTWTLGAILMALILLSSLSFTETDQPADPLGIEQTAVPAPAQSETPATPSPAGQATQTDGPAPAPTANDSVR